MLAVARVQQPEISGPLPDEWGRITITAGNVVVIMKEMRREVFLSFQPSTFDSSCFKDILMVLSMRRHTVKARFSLVTKAESATFKDCLVPTPSSAQPCRGS